MALTVSTLNNAWRETNEICAKQTKANLGKKLQTKNQKPNNQLLNVLWNNREQKEYTLRKEEKDTAYLGERGFENLFLLSQ